jgi:hypothetical protein
MLNARAAFNASIQTARSLSGLYDYLSQTHAVPFSFDDLLRSQIMYAVSAFDKLMHDLVRIGMVETFTGARSATDKYHAETISIKLHNELMSASIPPSEIVFEAEIARRLSFISFQDPQKVADGLSLIWSEPHKWQKIAASMSMPTDDARTKLKLITLRRNAIVHECDIDPITHGKQTISPAECSDMTDFIENCGNAVVQLVL